LTALTKTRWNNLDPAQWEANDEGFKSKIWQFQAQTSRIDQILWTRWKTLTLKRRERRSKEKQKSD